MLVVPPNITRRLPSLKALRAFEAAARNASFKLAADELNVSQSAISHQIKALEDTLGYSLFNRKPRAVELTLKGKLYYPIIRNAFDRIVEGTEMVLEKKTESTCVIQAYSLFTLSWLLPRLSDFENNNKELPIRIFTSQADINLEREDIDATIQIGQSTNPNLHYTHLFDTELFPVCSPEYLHKHGPINNPNDLVKHPIIHVYPSTDDWPYWLVKNKVENLNPQSSSLLQVESYNDALNSAKQGFGISLCHQPYMTEELAEGSLIDIFPDRRIRNPKGWYLICRKQQRHIQKLEPFRKWLLNQISQDKSISKQNL